MLNIGRQLHTVIVCLLDHDVLYVKVANALAIEWNIFCTTYSQVNKRWIIGGSSKKKLKFIDNCYISSPYFGALTPPMEGKYRVALNERKPMIPILRFQVKR